MQLEIYNLIAEENRISISLEAICDQLFFALMGH